METRCYDCPRCRRVLVQRWRRSLFFRLSESRDRIKDLVDSISDKVSDVKGNVDDLQQKIQDVKYEEHDKLEAARIGY